MHRRKTDINRSRRLALIVGGMLAVVIAVCLTIVFTAGGSSGGSDNTSASTQIEKVIQPASAAQVASSVHCGKFQDKFTAGGYPGVIDDGVCWIGPDKYAIDTFPSKAVRDEWLKMSEPLGVNPKWETDTSVVYPSVS
jgi:hypothetical protein